MLVDFKENLKQVIAEFSELKISIYLREWQTDFLRFYHSQTNYNISKMARLANVSLYKDKKTYSFEINNPTAEDLRQKIAQAIPIIEKLPPDPHFVDIESDLRKGAEQPIESNISKLPLDKKVEILKDFRDAVQPYDFDIYGTFICNYEKAFILNSNGVDKMLTSSPFYLEVKAMSNKNEVTVLEVLGGDTLEKISNHHTAVSNLVNKVKLAQNEIIDVPAGEYEVILAPRCVGEFMQYYIWSSLSASAVDQKESYLEGKVGERVHPECFTLIDSPSGGIVGANNQKPTTSAVIKKEYSSEGHLLSDLPIFEKGVFKNFLVPSYYAHKLGMEENGNGGDCFVMQTGDKSLDEMIASIKKGLYISSFNYVNFINHRETSLTGLTRDGTFLIEDGKITKVVNNLRFTDKIVDVINNISAIENKAYTIPGSDNYGTFSIAACSMPHIQVKSFRISSSTRTI